MVDYTNQINSLQAQSNSAQSSYNSNLSTYNSLMSQIASAQAEYNAATDPTVKASLDASYQALRTQAISLNRTMQSELKVMYDNAGTIQSLKSSQQTAAIDATPKPAATKVSSGSGESTVQQVDIPASKYASDYISPANAGLLSTTTTVTYTQAALVTKAELNSADSAYTTSINKLSAFQAKGDTSSPEYQAAKADTMDKQEKFELARDGLEKVTVTDKANSDEAGSDGDSNNLVADKDPTLDLAGTSGDLSTALVDPASTDAAPTDGPDIVVTAAKKITDQRVRIRAKDSMVSSLYTGVLEGLKETNGVFFPYTPTVNFSHKVNYQDMSPTHANTSYSIYNNTPAIAISIQGQFTAQNLAEAQYTMMAMHFFRTVTKMHFGKDDENAGLPPPVLVLSGYGNFMFNDLNVLITEFSMDLPPNVDYIKTSIGSHDAWVPAVTTFNVSCVVQQTPKMQRDDFSFDKFASGDLFGSQSSSKGWI